MPKDALSTASLKGSLCHHHLLMLSCQLKSFEQAPLQVGWVNALLWDSETRSTARKMPYGVMSTCADGSLGGFTFGTHRIGPMEPGCKILDDIFFPLTFDPGKHVSGRCNVIENLSVCRCPAKTTPTAVNHKALPSLVISDNK